MNYRAPRLPADHMVRLETRQGVTHATLRNISSDGVSFAANLPLRRGEPIFIVLGGFENEARIMWARHGLAAARLQTPLTQEELYRARNVAVRGPGNGAQTHWANARTRYREM